MMEFGLELVIILVMLIFNAVFAAYEMSLASISRAQLNLYIQQNKQGAAAAAFMKDRMEASLAVIQLGITLFGAIAAATGGAGIEESLSPYLIRAYGLSHTAAEFLSLVMLIIPLSVFTIVFAELFPKVFALSNQEWVCLKLSPFMKTVSRMAFPIVAVLEWSVKQLMKLRGAKKFEPGKETSLGGLHELKAAATLARASRLIGPREEQIVLSASELSQRSVETIMVPIQEISAISLAHTLSEALIQAHLDMHTRYPLCTEEKNLQTIQGYVNFKDIVTVLNSNPSDPSIRGISRPILRIENGARISQALEKLIEQKEHIALIQNREGWVLGMITLQDILEEIIGEVEDEYDRLPTHLYPYASGWIMGGGVPIFMVLSTLGIRDRLGLFKGDLTLSDWFEEKVKKTTRAGDSMTQQGIQVIVRKTRRRRISEAYVKLA